jgi:hypothetical protein
VGTKKGEITRNIPSTRNVRGNGGGNRTGGVYDNRTSLEYIGSVGDEEVLEFSRNEVLFDSLSLLGVEASITSPVLKKPGSVVCRMKIALPAFRQVTSKNDVIWSGHLKNPPTRSSHSLSDILSGGFESFVDDEVDGRGGIGFETKLTFDTGGICNACLLVTLMLRDES